MGSGSILKGSAFFEKHIRKNFLKYIVVLVIYIVGFLGGIIFFNHTVIDNEDAEEVSQYIINGMETFNIETSDILTNHIKKDFGDFISIIILSFSFIGIPVIFILLLYKSISLGVTVSALIHICGAGYGMSFSIIFFMIPVMLKILISLVLICSSLKLLENLLKYKKEMKYEMIRHMCTIFITFLILCILILYRTIALNIINNILF